jgi:cytochrome c peroxidase
MMKAILLVFYSLWALTVAFRVHADSDTSGDANMGERLFLETRFAQFFFTNAGGNANFNLTNGDPVMDTTASIYGSLPGAFAGQAMNCRACHLVQEFEYVGNRTYADFAPRSPIPANGDGRTLTPRNAIDLVNSLLPHSSPLFLHYDGQFASAHDLIIATLTGRNYGWRPTEYATAIAHIVNVIRKDNGSGGLAQQYGGWSYPAAFAGSVQIHSQYRISTAYRLFDVSVTNPADPNYVSDDVIVDDLAILIQAYLKTLVFSQDLSGQFNGSPYDVFLLKNGLPRSPSANETPVQYSQRLVQLIGNLASPRYVSDPADGHLATHNQSFQFGPTELAGLKIFFAQGGKPGRTGNCVACHSPPDFTDFLFHNTGATQEEYDAVHGAGSFLNLTIPPLSERQTNYDAYLEPTANHPNALGPFITPPSLAQPGQVDLGLWNVYANPDIPAPQAGLQSIMPQLISTHTLPPQISGATKVGNNFILNGAGGTPGWIYYVSSSTNVSFSPANWNIIATNTFDDQGHFTFTKSTMTNQQEFFQLSVGGPSPAIALPLTIALFKTPDLRDLSSSEPYLHTGRMNTIEDVLAFYQNFSSLARSGAVRNAAAQLGPISLDSSAVVPLAAFLRSLNEDYFDVPCPCP